MERVLRMEPVVLEEGLRKSLEQMWKMSGEERELQPMEVAQ